MDLTDSQRRIVAAARDQTVFVAGPAGAGKTTAGLAHLRELIAAAVPAHTILILAPQRALALPYQTILRSPDLGPGGQAAVQTIGGLAAEMVALFWPIVAERAGFANPNDQPTFLSLETAQYVMSRLLDPLLDYDGYFDSITIDRHRLYSQIIDNLNKAAVVGFPYTEIGERLRQAELIEQRQEHIFGQVQECATLFRQHCLDHNLLDFSLQVEIFRRLLLPDARCREYLFGQYRHLIVENAEEDTPATHALLRDWLPHCASALVLCDSDAGFRRFLGADPDSAEALRDVCAVNITLTDSLVTSPDLEALANQFALVMNQDAGEIDGDPRNVLFYEIQRFYPEMLAWVADEIKALVETGASPGEIVVMAPFLSDALRFSLMYQLRERGIPSRSHRPSRALREEPAARCLLTLAQIAHPEWRRSPTTFDLAYALMQAIGDIEPGQNIDLIRAQLLANTAYPHEASASLLTPFDELPETVQQRVTYIIGERYTALRDWLEDYIHNREQPPPTSGGSGKRSKNADAPDAPTYAEVPLDHFFSLIFGEVLSQPGFGFHFDFDAADVAGNLVESARGFRRTLKDKAIIPADKPIGQEYLEVVGAGLIADQYLRRWQLVDDDAVLLAPAYTFLMNNLPVGYQFWLDIGNRGWFERLYQPLTHPYVLSQTWPVGQPWTDTDEEEARRETLYRLMLGLIRRCRGAVYLGLSELGESGYESQGELLRIIQRILRRMIASEGGQPS
ncbi:MAG: ATP-dependent helicase [Chloroflexi bacterium]|nr:ATP-dependent helicase [Chloroflexota bacterium]